MKTSKSVLFKFMILKNLTAYEKPKFTRAIDERLQVFNVSGENLSGGEKTVLVVFSPGKEWCDFRFVDTFRRLADRPFGSENGGAGWFFGKKKWSRPNKVQQPKMIGANLVLFSKYFLIKPAPGMYFLMSLSISDRLQCRFFYDSEVLFIKNGEI